MIIQGDSELQSKSMRSLSNTEKYNTITKIEENLNCIGNRIHFEQRNYSGIVFES